MMKKKTRHRLEKTPYLPQRRGFKIERLPLPVQLSVFRAYGRGDTYASMRAALKAQGYQVSENALSRYWRKVWHRQYKKLRDAWIAKETLKDALQLEPDSPNAKVAEELLYTIIVNKSDEIEQEPPLPLLREARQLEKAAGKTKRRSSVDSPVQQSHEVRRRWRQLYGLNSDDEESKKD